MAFTCEVSVAQVDAEEAQIRTNVVKAINAQITAAVWTDSSDMAGLEEANNNEITICNGREMRDDVSAVANMSCKD